MQTPRGFLIGAGVIAAIAALTSVGHPRTETAVETTAPKVTDAPKDATATSVPSTTLPPSTTTTHPTVTTRGLGSSVSVPTVDTTVPRVTAPQINAAVVPDRPAMPAVPRGANPRELTTTIAYDLSAA